MILRAENPRQQVALSLEAASGSPPRFHSHDPAQAPGPQGRRPSPILSPTYGPSQRLAAPSTSACVLHPSAPRCSSLSQGLLPLAFLPSGAEGVKAVWCCDCPCPLLLLPSVPLTATPQLPGQCSLLPWWLLCLHSGGHTCPRSVQCHGNNLPDAYLSPPLEEGFQDLVPPLPHSCTPSPSSCHTAGKRHPWDT